MEILPLIKIKNRKIKDTSVEKIILDKEKIFKDKTTYFLDYDGIDKNKPNLCTIQKLSKNYDLCVDSAPKNLGDVVDIFMSGARAIVIRKKYYKNFNPINIKEISENMVFQFIEEKKEDLDFIEINKYIDGYISFENKDKIYSDFIYKSSIDQIKNKFYVYEEDVNNKKYWEKEGIKGLIIDYKRVKEFI